MSFLEALDFSDIVEDIFETSWSEISEVVTNPRAVGSFISTAAVPNVVGGVIQNGGKTGQMKGKRKFAGDPPNINRKGIDDLPAKRRNINHTPINSVTDAPQMATVANRTPSDGDEVPVIPVPKRIAKSYADYSTIKLPFVDSYTLLTGTSTTALDTHILRLNSCFDPSFTSVSNHQPMGRDKFAAFGYKYYRVLGCTVNLLFSQQGAVGTTQGTSNYNTIVGYSLSDDATLVFDDWRAFAEAKQTSYRILRPLHEQWDGSQKQATLSYRYSPEEWDYHVQETGVEERWTPIGTSPPNLHYLIINSGPAGHTVDTNVVVYVNISYTVQFREVGHITAIDTSG